MACLMSSCDGHRRPNMEIKAILGVKVANRFVTEMQF